MADPVATQNLCDAFANFMAAGVSKQPTQWSWVGHAKDFQPLIAAILAGLAAWFTVRATLSANRIAMEKLAADQAASRSTVGAALKKIESDEKIGARERERRKLGFYLRLRPQLNRLRYNADKSARDIESSLKNEYPPDDPEDVLQRKTVYWGNNDLKTTTSYDEFDNAWQNIDLFPERAIERIELLRSLRIEADEFVENILLKDIEQVKQFQKREDQVSSVVANQGLYYCRTIVYEADMLLGEINEAIKRSFERLKELE
jgi:hypothetical protein